MTNAQYARFLQAEDFADRALWVDFPKFDERSRPMDETWGEEGWRWLQKKLGDTNYSPDSKVVYPRNWNDPRFGMARKGAPVVSITWYEASAYCRWLGRHWAELGEGGANPGWQPDEVRLPREAEWVQAAGGAQPGERYPWDLPGKATNDLQEILRRANVREAEIGRTTPAGMYPLGASQPYGLWDMGGNVWEWQANFYGKDHDVLALRGGAWDYESDDARLSVWLQESPRFRMARQRFSGVGPPLLTHLFSVVLCSVFCRPLLSPPRGEKGVGGREGWRALTPTPLPRLGEGPMRPAMKSPGYRAAPHEMGLAGGG